MSKKTLFLKIVKILLVLLLVGFLFSPAIFEMFDSGDFLLSLSRLQVTVLIVVLGPGFLFYKSSHFFGENLLFIVFFSGAWWLFLFYSKKKHYKQREKGARS